MHTTAHLVDTIGHRQVSTNGEEIAAQYLYNEAKRIAADAATHRPDIEITVAREKVNGALGRQVVFGLEIANAYNGLNNIILKVAPAKSEDRNTTFIPKSVLVNAHYDSTLGTAGASDAASCVGVALELARTIVANASLPLKAPIIFLFNGGEETLMQASHGFMASSPFAKELGAFINLESTGPWGPDVVFQHSGDWTLRAYARVAPSPKGTTVGQDFFDLGVIPGDTDYRMFSYRHYGAIPGIDVAFLFDGTAYHTARDEMARIRPGTLQGMGDNMLATALEFSRVLGEEDFRGEEPDVTPEAVKGGHVFFDILARYMVVYSHRTAAIIHQIPLIFMLTLSLRAALMKFKGYPAKTVPPPWPLLYQAGVAMLSVLCAAALPALVGLGKAMITRHPIAWYSNHVIAYVTYIPAAAAGVLAPHAFLQGSQLSKIDQARRAVLGFALLFSGIATALTEIGMHTAYIFVGWAVGAISAALLSGREHHSPHNQDDTTTSKDKFSSLSIATICACLTLPITISLPTAMSIAGHIMEKIGLAGSADQLLGQSIPDAAIGALTGLSLVLALGAGVPYIAAVLGQQKGKRVVGVLFAISILAAAVPEIVGVVHRNNQLFTKNIISQPSTTHNKMQPHPYSYHSPKRVVFQHFHLHSATGKILDSFFTFSSMDPVPVDVALPDFVRALPRKPYHSSDWVALYPLNYLVTGIATEAPPPPNGVSTPSLRVIHPITLAHGFHGEKSGASLWSKILTWFINFGGGGPRAVAVENENGDKANLASAEDSPLTKNSTAPAGVVEGMHRWHLELDTVRAAWAVLNITGDIHAWSLGPEVASTQIPGTNSTCHMVRYASGVQTHRWKFWIDAPKKATGDVALHIELFVKHLQPSEAAQKVVDALPDWVSPTAVTTWHSIWDFTQ